MSSFAFVVGGVLPYLALLVFVVGMGYRLRVWMKTPQPGKMTLFPSDGRVTRGVLAEALFFPSLFRGDKVLWSMAWVFHVTLALVFVGHLRVVTGLVDALLFKLGMAPESVGAMSTAVGGAAGVVLLATGALLLGRRIAVGRVREISLGSDFFALLLVIAVVVTGDLMRFAGAHFDLAQTRAWALSLLSFSPRVPEQPMFLLHALLAQLLIMYMPFSKILHFGGIFFTQALVQRR
jgi:nitrate reductase gamma subunit